MLRDAAPCQSHRTKNNSNCDLRTFFVTVAGLKRISLNHFRVYWRIQLQFSLLSVFTGACGCSPERPPADFIQQVSQADHVVVTNLYLPVTFTITGEEFRQLSTAITNATRDKNNYSAVFDWQVQFYKGTNHLTDIHLQDRAFVMPGLQYSDGSGVLKSFYENWVKTEEPR